MDGQRLKFYLPRAPFEITELIPWVLGIAVFFLLPEYLALAARILIFIILVLSLDLIVGYAGVVSLGHGVFFGVGAYAAGIASVSLAIHDPLMQLLIAAACAGLLGLLSGAVVLRGRGLTLIMLTLAVASLVHEAANRATQLTGGADGLTGVVIDPLLGLFRFDMFGKTAYVYSLAVLFIVWLLLRTLCRSSFGASLIGIHQNTMRMQAIGTPVLRQLLFTYTLAAAIAGIAGALLTQTSSFVGLNTLGFELSGEILVMLILGGVGRLYGAFVGPVVFLVAQDYLAKQFPENWYLGIGVLLIVVILYARGGILGLLDLLVKKGVKA
ncbi:branched-chain amino acid ABC transporter permease [Pusillimonas sp.]|uniref:branched-chain amino acid ABC transporter permease n=1 Tax=Pusillimonas sp. TaxID=3040095 RepID=UPI0029A75B3F|nr:branched-chain amino acid ABC transporter permease [Pusillimonas sp.]MDX3894703.1 branched-chain amino acid ABC transporter permease [Pusillimonas sp.]